MNNFKYTAIVLNKRDYNETGRVYTLYTLEAGKIQALAQGVRKPQSKLVGALENFNLADVFVAKRNGMGRITGAIAENYFSRIKSDLEKMKAAFRVAELLDRMTEKEEKDEKLFGLLSRFFMLLEKMETENACELFLQSFILKTLGLLGYKLEADFCLQCRRKPSPEKIFFSAEKGGIICAVCSGKIKNLIPISANAVKIIRLALANQLESLSKIRLNQKDLLDSRRAIESFAAWVK